MPAFEAVRRWRGQAVLDTRGEKIGTILEIYYDSETDQPGWALLDTADLSTGTSLVPLRDAVEQGNEIRVPHNRAKVRRAPGMEPGGRLWPQDEAALYQYYDLPYSGGLEDDDEEDSGGTVTVGPSGRWHLDG